MDWKDLAGKLIALGAPVIGTALGGPLGGTLGGVLGNLVASALGVESTPEAVDEALNTSDIQTVQNALSSADQVAVSKMDALVKLAESEAKIQIANSEQVNATIQSENARDAQIGKVSWWHWRHLIGYATLAWIVGPLPPIMWFMVRGDIPVFNAIVAGTVALIPWVAIAAGLNGFIARDTTIQKQVAATGEAQPTIMSQVTKAVLPKKR